MARRATEDDWDDDEYPDDGEESPTIPCPHCRSEIHEDSQRCPRCDQYLSAEDAPPARKPWWLIAGLVACLACVYLWVVG